MNLKEYWKNIDWKYTFYCIVGTIVTAFLVFTTTGCKEVKLVGDKFAKIYPNDGYADVAEVLEQKPAKITDPEEVPMSDLQGFICVSEKQFAKYRRAYESDQESTSVLMVVEKKLNENRAKVTE